MKELTKIIGLLAMLTLVSCGSKSPSMEDLGSCINGDTEVCQDLGDDTPPVVEPPVVIESEFEMDEVKSVTLVGELFNTPTFSGFTMTLKTEGSWIVHPSGDGDLDTVEKSFLTIDADGTGTLELKSRGFYSNLFKVVTTEEITWEIVGDKLLINDTEVEFSL